jgi:O-antigen/teichoic acid export membrane protein
MRKAIARLRGRLGRLLAAALGASGPLVLSRVLSAALTFGLPLALVRLLEPAAFGNYKQFFLVAQTLLLVGQLGLTQSLYYFLPRGGAERGAYVSHAVLSLTGLGLLFGGALYLATPSVAGWVGAGELGGLAAPLAVFSGAMLAASPLEGSLTSEGRIGGAAIAYVVTDAVRASSLVLAARYGIPRLGPSAIFWAAAAVSLLRVAALWTLLARRVLPWARPRRELLSAQLAFALPFAGASLLYVGQRYCQQYVVSARFPPAVFALFTVASFHMPVVDIVFMPIAEVLMVALGRTVGSDPRASLHHFNDAVDKLASLLFPAACGAWLLGPTVLPLLFTHKYEGAVGLFLLTTLEIPLWILPLDALLRAAGDTRFLFAFNGVRVVVTTACVLGGIHLGGLPGAIVGGFTSESLARVVMLWRGRRFLGNPPWTGALDWGTLWRIAACAGLAAAPAWAVRLVLPASLRMILVSMAVYATCYAGLRVVLLRRPRGPVCAGNFVPAAE